MNANPNLFEAQQSKSRSLDMRKIEDTDENASHKLQKWGGCGCGHAKDQQAQPARKEEVHKDKHGHAHHSDGGSGCCGGGKASK
jgi:hypothetical protein